MKLGETRRTPERRCPKCGYLFTAATPVAHDNDPDEGSVTVCIECASILIFDERLTLRSPTSTELAHMQLSPDWEKLKAVRSAVLSTKSTKAVWNAIEADDPLRMWVVYKSPKDFPGKYVVRVHHVTKKGSVPQPEHWVRDTLTDARSVIPAGLVCSPRADQDERHIVETWF